MMRVLVLLVLLPTLAFGAIPTTTVTGQVRQPNDLVPTSGTITCTLSQAGSVLDGAVWQRVAGQATTTIGANGAVSFALVPNDAISPSGTVYACVFSTRLSTGRPFTWSETWRVDSSPDPVDIGAVVRVAPPGATFVAGPAGSTGVVAATAPVTYNSGTQTVGFNAAQLDASTSTVTATGGTTARTLASRAADVANVKDFGASGSAQATTGSINSGSDQLTVASAIDFTIPQGCAPATTAPCQGISVANAGAASALLVTKVTVINGLVFTLATTAGTTATNKAVNHDDTGALQAAANAAFAVELSGTHKISSTVTLRVNSHVWGTSKSNNNGQLSVIDATLLTNSVAIQLPNNGAGIRLHDFRVNGPTASVQAGSIGIHGGANTADVSFERLYIQGFYKGLTIGGGVQRALFLDLVIDVPQHAALELNDVDKSNIIGGIYANNGGVGSQPGNIRILTGCADVSLQGVWVDEAFGTGNSSILIHGANRIHISNSKVYWPGSGYGIRLGDGTNNPIQVSIENTWIGPFSTGSPTNTIQIRGSGHSLMNVITDPGTGGDISDLATDTVYANVNGRWQQPTTDASGTPGNATINKASGKVAIAIGAAAVTVTDSLVTAASIVTATMQATDATCTSIKSVVPAAGSFTITANANCTAATKVAFTVQN